MIKDIRSKANNLLYKKSQHIFLFKVFISLFLLFILLTVITLVKDSYYIIPQFCLGVLYVHMKELQHEAIHNLYQNKACNSFLGIVLGIPMLVAYSDYRYHHMLHHKYVGTKNDTEFFLYNTDHNFSIYKFICSMWMLKHYYIVLIKILLSPMYRKLASTKLNLYKTKYIQKDYQKLFLFILITLFLSVIFSSVFILKAWILPLFLYSIPINFLIELPEHVLCHNTSKSIFQNTRTIKTNKFMTWFVNNNNYHVEHHYNSCYPIFLLPELHTKIKDKVIYFHTSYIDFYKYYFKTMQNKQKNLV